MRDALLNACRFRWTNISPALFGSMFQLVKSKEARRDDGEHYTSETNILKTLGPLFLDELRAEADRLIAAKSTPVAKLRAFRDSLADMVFCDPACGSGNFLIVAYRELRKIETDMIVAIRERQGSVGDFAFDLSWEQKLSIGQFYGIELNWWPARIAETAMFLVDHQANRELADRVGLAPERLPISITAHIVHANALAVDWREILPATSDMTYIFGNPPFIGARMKTKEQKADLAQVWGTAKGVNDMDYVTGWHAQAQTMLAEQSGEFAFVTTNSITQGQQVPAFFGPLIQDGWRIKFAHRTFQWDSEAPGKAAVHCVIVGFTRDRGVKQRLWDYPDVRGEAVEQKVEQGINAYLIDGPNVLVTNRSTPLSPEITPARFGSMANDGGNLIVETSEYDEVADDPIAAKYLRPLKGSRELVRGLDRWCLWLADDFDATDVEKSPVLRERITAVRDSRAASKRKATANLARTPHLFGEIRQPETDYLCIPKVVSETRPYLTAERLSPNVIVSDLAFHAQDPDGSLFALVSSSMFITWQKTVGGRLKSDLRFSTLTWNTFPVPALDAQVRQRIIEAGQLVLQARERHPDRSLAEHYNPLAMAPDLLKAHDKLDREVDKAFGATRQLTTERQRQEVLFSNYATFGSGNA